MISRAIACAIAEKFGPGVNIKVWGRMDGALVVFRIEVDGVGPKMVRLPRARCCCEYHQKIDMRESASGIDLFLRVTGLADNLLEHLGGEW